MKRLRRIEEEDGKLKRMVADLTLDNKMLQNVIRRSAETYEACAAARSGR